MRLIKTIDLMFSVASKSGRSRKSAFDKADPVDKDRIEAFVLRQRKQWSWNLRIEPRVISIKKTNDWEVEGFEQWETWLILFAYLRSGDIMGDLCWNYSCLASWSTLATSWWNRSTVFSNKTTTAVESPRRSFWQNPLVFQALSYMGVSSYLVAFDNTRHYRHSSHLLSLIEHRLTSWDCCNPLDVLLSPAESLPTASIHLRLMLLSYSPNGCSPICTCVGWCKELWVLLITGSVLVFCLLQQLLDFRRPSLTHGFQ